MSYQYAAPSELRDPITLWPTFRVMVIVLIVLEVFMALLVLYEIRQGVVDPLDTSVGTMLWLAGTGLGGLAYIVVFIFCVVLFCKLTYRMMRNLHRLGSPEARITPGWAVGWHFIPVASWVMPVIAVGQMWRGTFSYVGEPNRSGPIGWWWACWLGAIFVGYVSTILLLQAGGFDEFGPHDLALYSTSNIIGVVSSLLSMAASGLVLAVYGPIVQAQSQMLRATTFQ